jgi:hypothetical protein
MPTVVTSSIIISPKYKEVYRLKFFQEEGLNKLVPEDMWVEQGANAQDPRDISPDYIAQRAPTAEFSSIHSGWNKSLNNIQEPTNFRPVFTDVRNTYDVYFYTNLID